MTEWLFLSPLTLSVFVLFLIGLRQPLRKQIGATGAYSLWLLIPVILLLCAMPQLITLPVDVPHYPLLKEAGKALHSGHKAIQQAANPLFNLWLLGAVSLFSIIAYKHLAFLRALARSQATHQTNSHNDFGGQVKVSSLTQHPVLVGFFRYQIVVPPSFNGLSPLQQRLIIEHEQVHHARKDTLWNLLALSILCLFWFNPLLWWGYAHFRMAQELACDAQVLSNKDNPTKATYAKTLLAHAAPFNQQYITALPYGAKRNLQERIVSIQSGFVVNKPKLLALIAALMLLGLVAVALFNAQASSENEVSPEHLVPASYPTGALQQGLEGTVTLGFSINTDGSVTDIKVLNSEHNGIFDEAAMQALQQWRYQKPQQKLTNQQVDLSFSLE